MPIPLNNLKLKPNSRLLQVEHNSVLLLPVAILLQVQQLHQLEEFMEFLPVLHLQALMFEWFQMVGLVESQRMW